MATNRQYAIFADLNMTPIRRKKADVDNKMMTDVAKSMDPAEVEMPQPEMERISTDNNLPSAALGVNGGMAPKIQTISGTQLPNNESQEEKVDILQCTK